jgi:hypothetical protein
MDIRRYRKTGSNELNVGGISLSPHQVLYKHSACRDLIYNDIGDYVCVIFRVFWDLCCDGEIFPGDSEGSPRGLLEFLDPEDDSSLIFRHVGNLQPEDTASRPRRHESSATAL